MVPTCAIVECMKSRVDLSKPCVPFGPENRYYTMSGGVHRRLRAGREWIETRISGPVHRFAYEAVYGPVPAGLQVDHLCFVRSCYHPAHLDAVTQAENLNRMQEERKRKMTRQKSMPVIKEWTPEIIRRFRTELHMSRPMFADALGVSANTVAHWEDNYYSPRAVHLIALDNLAEEYGFVAG